MGLGTFVAVGVTQNLHLSLGQWAMFNTSLIMFSSAGSEKVM